MKLDPNINKTHFAKCIICKLNPPNSYEHLIPNSIGGIIEWKALCKTCNDKLGYTLIKDVKKDPRIRLAIDHLKNILPGLFDKIENRQKYNSTDSKGNIIKHIYKDGKHRVLQQKVDESLIKGMEDTEGYIRDILKKTGKNEEGIKIELTKFHETEIDKSFQLTKEITIIKNNADLYHNFEEGVFLQNRFLILLAYEYISLFLGSFIYDDRLNYIREFILNQQKTDLIVVEEYSTRKYAPIHRLSLRESR